MGRGAIRFVVYRVTGLSLDHPKKEERKKKERKKERKEEEERKKKKRKKRKHLPLCCGAVHPCGIYLSPDRKKARKK